MRSRIELLEAIRRGRMRKSEEVNAQEQRLNDAIAVWYEAWEEGHEPDRAAFLARYPELADELKSFFAAKDEFENRAGPILRGTDSLAQNRVSRAAVGTVSEDEPSLPRRPIFLEIGREIARGGMGAIHRARDLVL